MEATSPLSSSARGTVCILELHDPHLLNLGNEEPVPHPEVGGSIPAAANPSCLRFKIGPQPELCVAWA